MSALSTHVLDLVSGRPASQVGVRLLTLTGEMLAALYTDVDGRAAVSADLKPQSYRLEFDIGAYFRATGALEQSPGFLETVAVEFQVAEGLPRLHVPLLVSPFGYSTYRGS